MVWMARKLPASSSGDWGSCSSPTRSRSSWSRFSWLSTKNSAMISASLFTTPPFSPLHRHADGAAEGKSSADPDEGEPAVPVSGDGDVEVEPLTEHRAEQLDVRALPCAD